MNWLQLLIRSRYEAVMLSRNILFKILIVATVGGICFLQFLMQRPGWSYSWEMVASASASPLISTYLYNLVQCFLVLFVFSEFWHKEGQGGTLEVLRARPMGNSAYFWGKVGGILLVFTGMNGVVVCIAMFINIVAQAPFSLWNYLFYWLTLSLPALVFMSAFALWVAGWSGSRMLSMFISLCLLYSAVTFLPTFLFGTFDILGISQITVSSEITGFPNLHEYLSQRFFVLFIGVGLLYWCGRRVKRLAEQRYYRNMSTWTIVWSVVGVLLGGGYVFDCLHELLVRDAYRASFVRHANRKACRVSRHVIVMRQNASSLAFVSELTLKNPHNQALSSLALFLNPGLKLVQVKQGDESVAFARDNQVVVLEQELAGGDSVNLTMFYEGKIDERYGYFDATDEQYRATDRGDAFFHFGRRYALVGKDALVLVPESGWYPTAIAPFNFESPILAKKDFTRFSLRVIQPLHAVTLSQGIRRKSGDTLYFDPPLPLDGISLCGGNYKSKHLKLNGLTVSFYYFKGHDVLSSLFHSVKQRDVKALLEKNLLLSYSHDLSRQWAGHSWYDYPGGRKLMFVEVPSSFSSCFQGVAQKSGYVQPGMIFVGERGQGLPAMSYLMSLKRQGWSTFQREAVEKNAIATFVRDFFLVWHARKTKNPFLAQMGVFNEYEDGRRVENLYAVNWIDGNRLGETFLYSEEFPEIDYLFKFLLHYNFLETDYVVSEDEIQAQHVINAHTREEIFRCGKEINDFSTIRKKLAVNLADYLSRYVARAELKAFLNEFYMKNSGEIPFREFEQAYHKRFGDDFRTRFLAWRNARPTFFRLKDLNGIEMTGNSKMRIHFYALNAGENEGMLSVNYSTYRNFNQVRVCSTYFFKPGEAKEIKIVDDIYDFHVNTGLSYNFPTVFIPPRVHPKYRNMIGQTQDTTSGSFAVSPDLFRENTVIVADNRSDGFSLSGPPKTLLQRLRKDRKLAEMWQHGFNRQVTRWTRFVAPAAYGDTIRDAYYKVLGKGKYKAEWKVFLPEAGVYAVYALLHTAASYHYVVRHGADSTEVTLNAGKITLEGDRQLQGWCLLGQYRFPAGVASVVLDDGGEANNYDDVIVADAVKWVKIK